MGDFVGRQLGNYSLIRLLGQGGFAEVYLGEHIYLDTQAAIKVLRTQLEEDESKLFRAEGRTIARLVHPHIIRVLEFGVEQSVPYLVMDYAPNGTLRKRHPGGVPVPLPIVVSYINQIASALQYAHDQKVIHRDVKPENMLLDRNNDVLLSDFGIAQVVSTHTYSTHLKQDLVGTIAYMAPEQIQDDATPKSDQYALGVVAYEWLCGSRPFLGSITEVAVRHALATPSSLREKVPALPATVDEVVMKALAKGPDSRFATVREFAEALERAATDSSTNTTFMPVNVVSTTTNTPVSSSSPLVSSSNALPPAAENDAGGSLVSLVPPPLSTPKNLTTPSHTSDPITPLPPGIGTPVPVHSTPTTGPIADEANEANETTREPVGATEASGTSSSALTQLAKTRRLSRRTVTIGLIGVAAVGVAGLAGVGTALLTHTRTVPPTPTGTRTSLYTYIGHTGQVWSAVWSPTGTRVASASSDKTVQVWDASNGGNPYTYTGHADTIYTAAWSPDGSRIASASYDKTVQVWDAQGGHPFTYNGHSSWVWTVQWSPDGTRIASGGGDRTVQVWNAITGKPLFTYRGHSGSVFAIAWSPDGKYGASTGADGTVQVWDAFTGSAVYTYQPYSSSLIWAIAWSPNSSRIASAGSDKTVQLWDSLSGDHLFTYYGHSDSVYAVTWSPDGKRVASGGDDKTAQVWDASNGNNVYTYSGHTGSVRSLAWSPKSKHIVSASWDKTVQVWRDGM